MSAVLPVYNRCDIEFEKGEGAYLHATNGKKYLDFAAGIAVNSLGHSHPYLVKEMQDQAAKLWHVSNMYSIGGLEELAKKMSDNSFADYVFFCNSGAEAVECAIKMTRKYQDNKGNTEKYRIVTFEGSFHGRTLATISAAKKDKVLKGFEPALEGFDQVPFDDLDAVKSVINESTAGILIEPILGEGGIRPASIEFMKGLRQLCDEHDLLLCFDEVQCGVGRTGTLYAYETFGVEPDVIASAKGLGGGFPIGACLSNKKAASGMTVGSHGSTYGNNPMAMRIGNAVMDVILEDGFLDHVKETAAYLMEHLNSLTASNYPANIPSLIEEVRGVGLMIGLKVSCESKVFVENLRQKGLLTVPAADNIVRLLPPLIIGKQEVDEAIEMIKAVNNEG